MLLGIDFLTFLLWINSAVNLYSMQQLYNIGLAGVIAVGVTGIVWAVTTDVEHDL